MSQTGRDLREVLSGFAPRTYAAIDGAQFDNLPRVLREVGLSGRGLFRNPGDPAVERAGPWLVPILPGPALDSVFAIVGDRPAAVFWSCFGDKLYDHLRRLNTVRLPAWAANDEAGPKNDDDQAEAQVLFRHWDPRVLGALMPLLDEAQFARVLGPANEIAYDAPDYEGVRRVVADPEWPTAPNGPLTLRSEQMLALADRRREVARRRVAEYLHKAFPEVVPSLSPAELNEFVGTADVSGRNLGIRTEAGHKRWAYLVLATNGQVTRTPGALDFIRNEGKSPDDQVRRMIDLLAKQARTGGGSL